MKNIKLTHTHYFELKVLRCYWLGAARHCPKVDTQKRPEHSEIRNCRQRAESLQIQTPPHTYSQKALFLYEFVHCFLGKSYLLHL